MKEYEAEVLEQYDMEVKGTRKMRGAFFCDTDEGAMLLKETKISERRASLVYIVLSRLELEGKMRVDTPVFAKDGRLLVWTAARNVPGWDQIYAEALVYRKRMRYEERGGDRQRGREPCTPS